MDNTRDFKVLQTELQSGLLDTTRTVGQISAEDLTFQRSLNPEVRNALDEQSERLLSLASALLKSAASISDLRSPALDDVEDLENNWRSVIDVVDSLLEKSDSCLYEYTGVIKRKDTAEPTSQTEHNSRFKRHGSTLDHSLRTQNIIKPQLAFEVKPDNQDISPWKPILTKKPHAILPLEDSLELITNNFDEKQYRNPYETEIKQLKYPKFVYKKAEPILHTPIDKSPATFVDTEEGVIKMLNELKNSQEIAIDLEHHEARSYFGLLSLMQISTRSKDWIIDTLKPWRHNLQILNEVFADPKILKVFHGSSMDIIWLQRDLGLYVVGLFDTFRACQALGYPAGSLAFLLKKFINFDADKVYQMADWRIRPLPEKMLYYARADTHFLLYIYDQMRNELVDKSKTEKLEDNLIEMVLEKSKETSLSRYKRQVYRIESGKGPGGWYSLLLKTSTLFNNEQFAVFRAVHAWRDKVSRIDDDSTTYTMPQHVLSSISKVMPTDMLSLMRIVQPASHSVKSRSDELLEVIKSAKATGDSGPSVMDVLRPKSVVNSKQPIIPLAIWDNHKENPVNAVDQGELRSEDSSFWGDTFGSSLWDGPKSNHLDMLSLSFQIPTISTESSSQSPVSTQSMPIKVSYHLKSASQNSNGEEIFTLKAGIKRKSDGIVEI